MLVATSELSFFFLFLFMFKCWQCQFYVHRLVGLTSICWTACMMMPCKGEVPVDQFPTAITWAWTCQEEILSKLQVQECDLNIWIRLWLLASMPQTQMFRWQWCSNSKLCWCNNNNYGSSSKWWEWLLSVQIPLEIHMQGRWEPSTRMVLGLLLRQVYNSQFLVNWLYRRHLLRIRILLVTQGYCEIIYLFG